MSSSDVPQDRFWQRHARRYDRATLFLNANFSEMGALCVADLRGSTSVLEVAAGTGLLSEMIAPVVERLTATDLELGMLDVLRGRLAAAGAGNVHVQQADLLALPFPDGSFDAVLAANVLHLLPMPGRALGELNRVLRPGGLLCAPTFAHGETLLAHFVSRLLALARFPIVTRFRGPALADLLRAHGFVVEREHVVPGILPLRYVAGRKRTGEPSMIG